MTQVPPPRKRSVLPTLDILLEALKKETMSEMNCVKVGVIKSFNAILQEAEIEIAFTQVTSVSLNGVKTLASYPLLLNVPVLFPAGGGFTLTFPVAAGDECIVLFNDRQVDNWVTHGAGLPPTVNRVHDLSDGIAIVGLRNNLRALGAFSTSSAQLRSDDGETYVELAAGGIVSVVAPTQINLTSPAVVISGTLNVENGAASAAPCVINGSIHTTGDVVANGISLDTHMHSGVTTGGGNTGGPI